jgi:hypothetical protein
MKVSILMLVITLGLTGCNNSSSSDKKAPAAPTPGAPIDLNQLDENENSTNDLSAEEQDVAYETMTDAGRVKYINSTSQDNTDAKNEDHALVAVVKTDKITPASNQKTETAPTEEKYFDNEELAKSILAAVNDKALCSPTIKKTEQTAEHTAVHFSTSGANCALIMETKLDVSNDQSETNSETKATGSFKFKMNDAALDAIKEQDILSGEMNINFNQKSKFPSPSDSIFSMAGQGTTAGTYISRRLGPVQFSQTDVVSMVMDTNPKTSPETGPSTANPMNFKINAVSQIELKALNKRVVFTVKMDSTADEPVVCSMNKKKVDIEKCKELVNQLGLKPST